MTTQQALLRAILCAPDEDTARLVYADYLEENGEGERAEFIRVQCCVSRTDPNQLNNSVNHRRSGESHCHCRFCDALARERELKRTRAVVYSLLPTEWHTKGWGVSAGTIVVDGGILLTTERGFISHITCDTAAFPQHAKAIFARHPVTAVTLTGREPRITGDLRDPCYVWDTDARDRASPSTLPDVLWSYVGFPTKAEALSWLSRKCVALGRSREHGADLPPLPAPERAA